MNSLEKDSLDACGTALLKYGFKTKRRGILLLAESAGCGSGWLGLNTATRGSVTELWVNPVIGVRHSPLEGLILKLVGGRAPMPAVSRPLGYLMPQNNFAQWEFRSGADLAPVARTLADSVNEYGLPFIEKWSDWRQFSERVADSGLLLDNEKSIVLPLVSILNGNRRDAEELVIKELERVAGLNDVYSNRYREFAAKFRSEIL